MHITNLWSHLVRIAEFAPLIAVARPASATTFSLQGSLSSTTDTSLTFHRRAANLQGSYEFRWFHTDRSKIVGVLTVSDGSRQDLDKTTAYMSDTTLRPGPDVTPTVPRVEYQLP